MQEHIKKMHNKHWHRIVDSKSALKKGILDSIHRPFGIKNPIISIINIIKSKLVKWRLQILAAWNVWTAASEKQHQSNTMQFRHSSTRSSGHIFHGGYNICIPHSQQTDENRPGQIHEIHLFFLQPARFCLCSGFVQCLQFLHNLLLQHTTFWPFIQGFAALKGAFDGFDRISWRTPCSKLKWIVIVVCYANQRFSGWLNVWK